MDDATLYITVEREIEKEFQEKYMKYKFSGVNGPFEMMKKYDTIDYYSVYEIIDEYKRKQEFDSNKKSLCSDFLFFFIIFLFFTAFFCNYYFCSRNDRRKNYSV